MNLSYVRYVADGTTDEFDVPFPFVNRTHIRVIIDGNPPVLPLRWAGESRIKIADRIAPGSIVEIRRETPISVRLVDFQNGSVLTEEELDTALNQIFFLQQELRDRTSDTLNGGLLGLAENEVAIDAILSRVLSDESALELSNAVNDIANQGTALSQAAVDLSALRGDHESLVGLVDALTSTDPGSGIATLIADETAARISGDNALATSIGLIGARSGDNLSFILNLDTVRVGPTESFAQRLSALTASDAGNAASIAAEQTARVSGDNALASSISTLTTAVNGNTATVTQLSSSVNGLSARYGVSLDVNGFVTGFVQNNDGQTGTFAILADSFSVVSPGGGTPVVPFEVSGGSVFIKEAFIGSLNVGRLTSGVLTAGITQNADWNVGTGRIIWDNGSHMKVAGVGFGSANQFIEWFGPKIDISLCTEANAIQYLKTNGDAFFGGSLSAGVLKNAARSTQVSATASVSTGSFGSNGGQRVVVVSYSSFRQSSITGSCNGSGFPSVTIELLRNGVVVQTFTATGSVSCTPGFGEFEPGEWEENLNSSFTFTDNSGGITAEYTARLTSRPLATPPSSTTGPMTHTQSLGIVSTEQ